MTAGAGVAQFWHNSDDGWDAELRAFVNEPIDEIGTAKPHCAE